MPYTTRAQLLTKLPEEFLVAALDDDGDGVEDAGLFDLIEAAVGNEIDGFMQGRYPVPFTDPPPAITAAALLLVAEAIYQHRGFYDDKNPFTKACDAKTGVRSRLALYGSGGLSFTPQGESSAARGRVVKEKSMFTSGGGNRAM